MIIQHTHMARAVCSLPPKRKRKDILRSFFKVRNTDDTESTPFAYVPGSSTYNWVSFSPA